MSIYRIRISDVAAGIVSDREYVCPDDDAAFFLATRMVDPRRHAEIWQWDRAVGELRHTPPTRDTGLSFPANA